MKKFSMGVALAVMAVSGVAFAGAHNDVVIDGRTKHLHDSRGNCVYTKWTEAGNKCHGEVDLALTERTVYFDFDSALLTPQAKAKLNYLASRVKQAGGVVRAEIVGHTDKLGNASYNQSLSARRARAVQAYLASLGLNDTSVTTVEAKGASEPVTQGCGKDINCLQADRRVEVHFIYGEAHQHGHSY